MHIKTQGIFSVFFLMQRFAVFPIVSPDKMIVILPLFLSESS